MLIRLRHILHPIRSAKSLYYKCKLLIHRQRINRKFSKIRRDHREKCWCGGELLPFKLHATYGLCDSCGSYANRIPPRTEELSRIYSFGLYWHDRQKLKGYPTIEYRSANDRSDGRVKYWLNLIKKYGYQKGRVVEVGCAHGVLLAELKALGYDCIGVEPDERTALWVRQNLDIEIRSGFFPEISLPKCDIFLAFDVLEHIPDPINFMNGVCSLLNPKGIAIIQVPIECHDYEHPFIKRPDFFDDLEHLFLYTDKAINKLISLTNLEIISLEDSLGTLGQICVLRKPD